MHYGFIIYEIVSHIRNWFIRQINEAEEELK